MAADTFRAVKYYWLMFTRKLKRFEMPEYTSISVFAIITGIATGLAAVSFHKTIELFNFLTFDLLADRPTYFWIPVVILIPALGMFIQSIMIKTAPVTSRKRGVVEVIKAVAMRGGYIPGKTTLFHFFAPAVCIGTGGTVGPEGPTAQIGGGVASQLGRLFGLSDSHRRTFTAAGGGAAIAAVFNTPLGGIFFALEILLLNDFRSPTFSALILASVSASAISRIFLGNTPTFVFDSLTVGSYEQFYLYILLGLGSGFLSLSFIRYSGFMRRLFKGSILKKIPQMAVMIGVGLIVGFCGFLFPEIFGVGYLAINKILAGSLSWKIILILLGLKFILVPLILQSGGFGGVFAPTLFIGACFGYLFSVLVNYFWGLNLDPTAFVLVSMGAVLGGVNSIPITSILIIFEMTRNYTFILPLMLAVIISSTLVQLLNKGSVHIKHLEDEGYRISSGRESNILRSITVDKVMRSDITLIPEKTSLPKLIAMLLESPHGTIYTVNEENQISGIITENELRPIITEYEHIREMIVAGDISKPNVTLMKENDDLDHVLKMFGRENVDKFPVVSAEDPGKIIGTVLRQDVIAAYNRESIKFNLADGLARELKTIDKLKLANVTEGYSILEQKVKPAFVGKTLPELRLRNKFGLEVLMIRQKSYDLSDESDPGNIIFPAPDYKIRSDDTLILFGSNDVIEQTNEWL